MMLQGGEEKILDEVQIDATGPAHLRSVLGDGESFEVYGDPTAYNFSAKTRYVPSIQQAFNLKTSQKSGCDFEANLIFTNPYSRTLHVHSDTNGSYTLQDGYVWLHNEDYSFYSYAYLDASGDATFYVEADSAYTLHYKNTEVFIDANQSDATLSYVDIAPSIYHYFTKEEGDIFETLNVIALDDDVLLDINVTQDILELKHNYLEQSNAYHFWRFNINATLIGNNIFGIKVKDTHNEISSQAELNIPNYLPEILSITFSDRYGDVFDLNDTIYNTDYNLTIITGPDKNGHTVKTWGSFNPNSSYSDSKTISMTSGKHMIYLNANDGYETVTKPLSMTINPYLLFSSDNNLLNETIELGTNKTYFSKATDPYGEELHYQWYINGKLISGSEQLPYQFNELGDFNIRCNISNRYKSITKSSTVHVIPQPILLGENNIIFETVELGTNKTYFSKATDPYGEELHYQWYINGELISEDAQFNYDFDQLGYVEIRCDVSNRYTSVTRKATIHSIGHHNIINETIGLGTSKTYFFESIDSNGFDLYHDWYINEMFVSDDEKFTYTFNELGDVNITCEVYGNYGDELQSATIQVIPKPIVTGENNIFDETMQAGTSKTYFYEATDPYDEGLHYEWYVNGALVSEDEQFTYMFTELGDIEVMCKVSNRYSTVAQSAMVHVTYEAPKIIDLNELPAKLLFGNYTFFIAAQDMQFDKLTYEWLINESIVSTDANFTKRFEQDGDITLTCNVSNRFLSTTVSRSTTIYYPKPVITQGLENTQTTGVTTFTVSAYHDLEYGLTYEWFLDGVTVATSETYDYSPQDSLEHTLTCKVSNHYKSVETSASIGETIAPKNLVIDTFPGNHVVIYDDDMNITDEYITDNSGIVHHLTTKSHINFAVIMDQNSTIGKDMFFKFMAGTKGDICSYVTGILPAVDLSNYDVEPDFYIYSNTYDTNSDGYLDANEIYVAGLDEFDSNGNGHIEAGELKGDKTYSKPIKAVLNMHYPISSYVYKDETFMSVIDGSIYIGNGRFVDGSELEAINCKNRTYIDVTITDMPRNIYIEPDYAFFFEPIRTYRWIDRSLPQNSTIGCHSSGGATACTYRIHAYETKPNGLSNYSLMLHGADKFLYLNDVNASTSLTFNYADMKDMEYLSELDTSNDQYYHTVYTQIVDDDIHTVSSKNPEMTPRFGGLSYLNNYWFSMRKKRYPRSGYIEYDESSNFTKASNDSLVYYLELSYYLQVEEAKLQALDVQTFYRPHLENLFYVNGSSELDVNFVTYEYRLACKTTSYIELSINLPNEYYETDPTKRFIGFFNLDTNKSVQKLFPSEVLQDLKEAYEYRDSQELNRASQYRDINIRVCEDMSHFRLLQFKGYIPFERDMIIEQLKTRQPNKIPRLEKSYYKFSGL